MSPSSRLTQHPSLTPPSIQPSPQPLIWAENTTVVADICVDSVFYDLVNLVRAQAYNELVYGFVAHGLAANSRKYEEDGIQRIWTYATEALWTHAARHDLGVYSVDVGGHIIVAADVHLFITTWSTNMRLL